PVSDQKTAESPISPELPELFRNRLPVGICLKNIVCSTIQGISVSAEYRSSVASVFSVNDDQPGTFIPALIQQFFGPVPAAVIDHHQPAFRTGSHCDLMPLCHGLSDVHLFIVRRHH